MFNTKIEQIYQPKTAKLPIDGLKTIINVQLHVYLALERTDRGLSRVIQLLNGTILKEIDSTDV